jgi:NAD(P)-dependent dehydrogenase (short-subunit alcohol dehydrogenase family)
VFSSLKVPFVDGILKDRVAVITGAGRGLGRAFALAMAKEGAKVLVNDLGCSVSGQGSSTEPADGVVEEISRLGGTAAANYDSIADSASATRIIQSAVERFGKVDILVNNAGTITHGWIWEIPDSTWEGMVQVNVNGYFYSTRAACLVMKGQKYGRIINISSGAGLGVATEAAYSTVKEAQIGLTRTVAKDMAQFGVTCNAIRPRAAATRFAFTPELYASRKENLSESDFRDWQANRAAQTPEKIAPLAVYLASQQAGAVNGCIFDMLQNYIAIYDDPPRFAKTLNMDGDWNIQDLELLIPKTLLKDPIAQSPVVVRRMTPDAQSWEWQAGELVSIPPQLK